MCQGFSGNKKDNSNQNLLDTYKDFGSQAVNMPGNINLIKKRKEHREKRVNILSNGGDDIGPPNF